MAKKRTKSTPEAVSTALEDTADLAATIFRESLTAIRDEIRGIVAKRIKPKDHDPASRIAWLAQHAAAVAAEQRRALAGELAALRKLTHATVVLWAKQQTPEHRARLLREVMAIDSKERRSVLG